MSTNANGTATMSGTFVEKSSDPDASKNSDDEDDEDEGTLIIRGDSVESMGYTETAIVKTTVEKDTQKRPVSSKISEIAKSYEKLHNNNTTNNTKSSAGTSNGTFVVNGTDTANNTSPRLSSTTPRQSVTSPFGSKRFEGTAHESSCQPRYTDVFIVQLWCQEKCSSKLEHKRIRLKLPCQPLSTLQNLLI